jgi:putative ABC transport system ATP-binding protein
MQQILKTHSITKIYHTDGSDVEALRGVTFSMDRGEFVALMGPSGCGKSTFLHLIAGLDHLSSGQIYLVDDRVDQLNETQWAILRRKHIGFVFQFFNLIDNMSVADNVEIPALLLGIAPRKAIDRREYLLAKLRLSDKAKAFPSQLSGGEQQRVAIGRALVNQPTILILDEPTGNLDSTSANNVLDLLTGIHTQGQTILMITHDMHVASVANRVVFMRDGQITGESILEGSMDPLSILSNDIKMEI